MIVRTPKSLSRAKSTCCSFAHTPVSEISPGASTYKYLTTQKQTHLLLHLAINGLQVTFRPVPSHNISIIAKASSNFKMNHSHSEDSEYNLVPDFDTEENDMNTHDVDPDQDPSASSAKYRQLRSTRLPAGRKNERQLLQKAVSVTLIHFLSLASRSGPFSQRFDRNIQSWH
jgi:hypothetical protein